MTRLKLVVLLFAICGTAWAACPTGFTSIVDTITNTSNTGTLTLFAGRVTITPPSNAISTGSATFSRTPLTVTVTAGAFSGCLVPNDTALPPGTSYSVSYQGNGGERWQEIWVVPTSGSALTIRTVRQLTSPSVLPYFLTTKGDLLGFSTFPGRFGVGANGYVLTADSTQPFGFRWSPSLAGNAATATALAADPTDCSGNNFALGISANGTANCAQPGFSNLSGQLLVAQIPAFSGDVTKPSGSFATTVTALNGTALSGLGTGLLKNTTGTGVPSIAVAGTDFVGGQATLTANNTIPRTTASGILGPSALLDDGTYLSMIGRSGFGLGTASPLAKLDVVGNIFLGDSNGASAKQMQLIYDLGNDRAYIQAVHQGVGYMPLLFNPSGGNIGFGLTTPTQLLTLKSTASAAWDNGSGTADTGLSRDAAGAMDAYDSVHVIDGVRFSEGNPLLRNSNGTVNVGGMISLKAPICVIPIVLGEMRWKREAWITSAGSMAIFTTVEVHNRRLMR